MKKTLRIVSLMLVMVLLCGAMLSCSKVSESYADKINKAAEEGENLTYAEVKEDLGDNIVLDATGSISAGNESGMIIAVKGCETWEEVEEKLDDGDTVKGIYVTFVLGKATKAEFKEVSKDDK